MFGASALKPGQRKQAPEVVQTSAMDCGPAALKSLLEGFGVNVSYARLREACQTDLDGASIDVIEALANELGVVAEQAVLPLDRIFGCRADTLPALVVVKRPDGAAHFVVVWRREGSKLQVMDPAVGRRVVSVDAFQTEVFPYETSIPAADWRDWAGTDDFVDLLRRTIEDTTRSKLTARLMIEQAAAEARWFRLAALDAAVRLTVSIIESGGVKPGRQAEDLLVSLYDGTVAGSGDIFGLVPQAYWSVIPDLSNDDVSTERLVLKGAVILKLSGRQPGAPRAVDGDTLADHASPLMQGGLREAPLQPVASLWRMLREDGLLAPLSLAGAMVLGAGAVLVQLVLFKSLLDVGMRLNLGVQRVGALVMLAVFMNILMMIEIPIVMETQRLGRRLEMRLRMALLTKLPRLNDRYFLSRPISDMAERSHGLYQSRLAPGLGLHLVQTLSSLIFTLAAMFLLDPASIVLGVLIATAAIVTPIIFQPALAERDLRVRSHLAALNGVYLDAMLGVAPIRAHGAQRAVSAVHEGLMTQWARSGRRLLAVAAGVNLIQAALCTGGSALLLYLHFTHAGSLSGGDLLLVYWTLRLPAIGGELSGLAQQYPAQRNVLARLMEPLSAPDAAEADGDELLIQPQGPAAIHMTNVEVRGGGHVILTGIDLDIRAGEHVTIVGASGAGKSTLFGLLMGWQTPSSGAISVDGSPLSSARLTALRGGVAWVDPMVHLWNRSFLDNLTYAMDTADPDMVDPALEAALLRPVLHKLPNGLQTYLGEGGARLSGGEGQRLRLGRALMQTNVRLALLDEPFRGLDRSQRTRLLRETRDWWRDVTLVCISHDIAETLAFDRVLVVENGRIIEDGAPQVLRTRSSRYRALLDVEERLNREMWAGDDWRRIVLRDGLVIADDDNRADDRVAPMANRFKVAGLTGGAAQAARAVMPQGDHDDR